MMKKIRKGFTLIEMVIVLFIISLLLLIMIPNLANQKEHATTRSNQAFKTTLVTQAEMLSDNSDDNKKEVKLQDLEDQHYISKAQHKRANDMGYKDDSNILDEKVPDSNAKI